MTLEVKCACANCNTPQTITIPETGTSQFPCPNCGEEFLAIRRIAGYLYILTNPSMPGLVKIGITTRPVSERVAELNSATGVPEKFKVAAYFESSEPSRHESTVHKSLGHTRKAGKEFFAVDLMDAIDAVRKITGSAPCDDSAVRDQSGGRIRELRKKLGLPPS